MRTRVCVCVCFCVCLRLVIQPPRDPSGRRQARIKMRRFRLRFLSRPQTEAPQRVRCPGVTRGRAAGQAGLSLSPSSVSFNGGLFPLCSCSLFYWPMGSYQKPLLVSPEDFLFQAPSYLGVELKRMNDTQRTATLDKGRLSANDPTANYLHYRLST